MSGISTGCKNNMHSIPCFKTAIYRLCQLELENTAIATLSAEGTPLKFFGALEKCWSCSDNGKNTAWAFFKVITRRLCNLSLGKLQLLFGNKNRNHFETLRRLDEVLCDAPCEVHFQLTNNVRKRYGSFPLAQIALALPQTAQIRYSRVALYRDNPSCHIRCDQYMTLLDWFGESIVATGYPESAMIKIRLLGTSDDATIQDLASWLDAYTNIETRNDANSSGDFIGQDKATFECDQVKPDGNCVIGLSPDGLSTKVVSCDSVLNGLRGYQFRSLCSVSDYPNPGQGYVLLVVFDTCTALVKHFKIPCQNLDEQDWQVLVELNNVNLNHNSAIPWYYSADSGERIRKHAMRLPKIVSNHFVAEPLPPNHLKDCHYFFSFNN